MAEYSINVKGYYKEDMTGGAPSTPGIFFVYRGVHDIERNRAILKELLYIGETSNLHGCLNRVDNINQYSASLQTGECLFFCYAEYQGTEEECHNIANMLIEITLPSLNNISETKHTIEKSIIRIEGDRHAFLPSRISMS